MKVTLSYFQAERKCLMQLRSSKEITIGDNSLHVCIVLRRADLKQTVSNGNSLLIVNGFRRIAKALQKTRLIKDYIYSSYKLEIVDSSTLVKIKFCDIT